MRRARDTRHCSALSQIWWASCGIVLLTATSSFAAEGHNHTSTTNAVSDWPTTAQIVRVVTLQDYNTRVVFCGTLMLGISAGVVGSFMLLRKRSLMGDVVGHASLPGIAIAFLTIEWVSPGADKSLPALLLGANFGGIAGMLTVIAIRRLTKIKEDAALAITLSVFFGLGITLFTLIQQLDTGSQAGLMGFIEGKAATMTYSDVRVIVIGSIVVFVVALMLFKELTLLCFDQQFAATQGWPVLGLDIVLMILVVGISVVGLQSVGLLLVVAMLIVPPSAARFWTDHLRLMTVIAAAIGGTAAGIGVILSALFDRLPAGPIIVLVGAVFFGISMICGSRRGLLLRTVTHVRLQRSIRRHHLLRALYENREAAENDGGHEAAGRATIEELLAHRSWDHAELRRSINAAWSAGFVYREGDTVRLSEVGLREARRVVRNHRLWELYLIRHADIAPSHVDRDADQIEHILEPAVVDELEEILADEHPAMIMPPSPHKIGPSVA